MTVELLEDQDIGDNFPIVDRIKHWYIKVTGLSGVPHQNWNAVRVIQIAFLYEAGSAVSETNKATELLLEQRIEAKFKELVNQFPKDFFVFEMDHSWLLHVYKNRVKLMDGKAMWRKYKDYKRDMRKYVAKMGSDLYSLPSGKNLYSIVKEFVLKAYAEKNVLNLFI